VNPELSDEVIALLERADQSIRAAEELAVKEYYDFAASRAYYAAFYAAKALILHDGLDFTKHSAVIAAIHQHYVKPGRLHRELGKSLNQLFELRGTGDYGGMVHVSQEEVNRAIELASEFLRTIKKILASASPLS
jgi:uncharacterized protein (UPF0332 family)